MKDVKLEFDGYWIDVENGWLCMGDEENQVLLRPEYFKKLLAAINYTHCCKSDSEQLVCDDNELDCPFDFTSRCTIGRCNCKPKAN